MDATKSGRVVVATRRTARRWHAASEWLSQLPTGAAGLVVAASRGAADDFLRLACREAGRGRFGFRRVTLYQLANELASRDLARRRRAPLSELGAVALAARASHVLAQDGQLTYFSPVVSLPGFPGALLKTLDELRLADLDAGAVSGLGRGGGDLGRLLDQYEAELERWRLADRAEVLHSATQALKEGSPFAGQPLIWLDLQLTCELESRFLVALAAKAGGVFATAVRGDEDTVERLETILSCTASDLGESEMRATDRLSRVQLYIFEPEVPAAESESAHPSTGAEERSLEFFSAPGEGQEAVEIARRARDFAAAGVPFDRMAIFVRQRRSYLPLIEDALRRAGIPAYFSSGTTRPDPAGRAFLALLACAAERLSASRFAEYVSLGQVPELDDEGAPPRTEIPWVEPEGDQFVFKTVEPAAEPATEPEVEREVSDDSASPATGGSLKAPFHWERLLVDAAVVGGGDRWARRLDGLEAELEVQHEGLGGEDEGRRAYLRQQIERLGHLKRFALPLVGFLGALPRAASWGIWRRKLEELAGMSLRRPETVLTLLAELRPMDEIGPLGLEHVRRVLEERLNWLRTEPPARRYGRLFIATVDEALGRSFEVVFLPGLAEGVFPRPVFEDPLLLDEERARIDVPLTGQEERQRRERLRLRLALGAAERYLVVSYSRLDAVAGRSRVPSFYALDLLRAARGALPELKELLGSAAQAAEPRAGWPAPSVCEDAIDDAEYDLALLRPLIGRPGEENRGQGRFLLECNPHLARALRSRARRWRRRWSAADGLVVEAGAAGSDSVLEILAGHRLGARSYSATALQHYAACPYRFFLQAIQRLRPRDQLTSLERLDPLTRGSLFHATQFALFAALKSRRLLPLSPAHLSETLDLVDQVLDETAERYAEELVPAIVRVWRSEIESLRTDLRGWVLQVMEEVPGWCPIHSELAFGLPAGRDRDPSSREEPVTILDGVKLRGSIDLVEAKEGWLRVTDHKTGRAISDDDVAVGGGRLLQPLLYALAAQEMLGGSGRVVKSGRLFYCTQRGGYRSVEVPLDAAHRETVQAVVETIDAALEEGFLPAAPEERDCSYCDYRTVCGPYEEFRVKRKPADRLAPLTELRGLR